MFNRKKTPIKVREIELEGLVISANPLSQEWHRQIIGSRLFRKSIRLLVHTGYPQDNFFTVTTRFENPSAPEFPIIIKEWPIKKENADRLQGQKLKEVFYAHENGLYQVAYETYHFNPGGRAYLKKATENCKFDMILNFKIINE